MNLDELKSVTTPVAKVLGGNGWTVEKLSTASVKDLTGYPGIGKVTAQRIIAEAQEAFNQERLAESKTLDYQARWSVLSVESIVNELINDGLSLEVLALSPVRNLEGHKGIDRALATKIISHCQGEINKRKLYESQVLARGGTLARYIGQAPNRSAAFPEEWLSGAINPPPMSVRVKRAFDQAKAEYEAENG